MNTMRTFAILGRRTFFRMLGGAAGFLLVTGRATITSAAEVKDYLGARIRAVYHRDTGMQYRRSQDNPMIRRLYTDYLDRPMSRRSEEILHTSYTDRSAGVK